VLEAIILKHKRRVADMEDLAHTAATGGGTNLSGLPCSPSAVPREPGTITDALGLHRQLNAAPPQPGLLTDKEWKPPKSTRRTGIDAGHLHSPAFQGIHYG
jgi:hypothetical protein